MIKIFLMLNALLSINMPMSYALDCSSTIQDQFTKAGRTIHFDEVIRCKMIKNYAYHLVSKTLFTYSTKNYNLKGDLCVGIVNKKREWIVSGASGSQTWPKVILSNKNNFPSDDGVHLRESVDGIHVRNNIDALFEKEVIYRNQPSMNEQINFVVNSQRYSTKTNWSQHGNSFDLDSSNLIANYDVPNDWVPSNWHHYRTQLKTNNGQNWKLIRKTSTQWGGYFFHGEHKSAFFEVYNCQNE